MRKIDAAEWLLSLTTTRERAASTAGDLLEGSSGRGTFWFWWSLGRTTTSNVWASFTGEPWKITGLAVRMALRSVLYFSLIFSGIVLAHVAIAIAAGDGSREHTEALVDSATSSASVEGVIAVLLSSIPLGTWLARKAAQQELAVLMVSWVLARAVWTLALIASPTLRFSFADLTMDLLLTIATTFCMFVGISRVRKRSSTIFTAAG